MAERPAREIQTAAAHAGEMALPAGTHPAVMPIYQASVWSVPDIATGEAIQSGAAAGYVYARNAHPNATALEATVAELEGGEAALASASGMGSLFAALYTLLAPGAHLIAAAELYGGTYDLVEQDLKSWGVQVTYVDALDPDAVATAIRPETRLLLAETITNPTVRVCDLSALAAICRERGVTMLVDNTFASPALCRPLALGATISMNSATKFLGGKADLTAGVLACPADLIASMRKTQIRTGAMLDPFAAWLCLRGIKTLGLRVERQSANALALGRFLAGHPQVEQVNYPGLAAGRQGEIARRLLPRGFGPMLSFALRGDLSTADRVIAGLRLAAFAPSLGDVATTVSHPMSTSHRAFTPAQRVALGIGDNLIRVNVGSEAIDDIVADFDQALAGV